MSDTQQQSILQQLGGISGLVSSTLPILLFVPVNSLFGLTAAIWAALGVAAVVLVWRLVVRGTIQPAISGFIGVGIGAFIAHRTGDAKGYFLFGIYTSLLYAGVFMVSVLVRWPLVGVLWGFLNGHGHSWRQSAPALRAYDIATIAWALVFGARYLVQSQLYDTDHTGWLAFSRIAMGWPLTALVLLATVLAVRRADRIVDEAEAAAGGVDAAAAGELDTGEVGAVEPGEAGTGDLPAPDRHEPS